VWSLFAVAIAFVACGPTESLDVIADEYVQLTLAIGRHDPNYVDAYYGPDEWKREAARGEPIPPADLLDFTRELLTRLEGTERSDRREYLQKQLTAAEAWLRRASGESMSLAEEVRLLYDIELPSYSTESFAAARDRLEQLVPGDGDLQSRVEAFRSKFIIPPHRLNDVARAALSETRDRTIGLIDLPVGEAVRLSFVHDKPWGAYNYYQGDLTSQIEVNTDLPVELAYLFGTLSHESYPGHHTYNALLEDRLVRGRGWNEFSVYPLYSPQSLIAEGTADSGLSVVMDDNERWTFLEERLGPIAGVEKENFAVYRAVLEALRALKPVRGEAARMLLEDGADEEEVVAFLMEYGLESRGRARKTIEFIRAYRGYTYTYFVGEEIVLDYLGEGPDRAQRYFDLLQRPLTPSELK
jgi:hypothetical protein